MWNGTYALNMVNMLPTRDNQTTEPETIPPNIEAFLRDMKIAIPCAFAAIFFIGITGNLVVCITLLCLEKLRRRPTYVFILNLAFSDLCFVSLCVPFTATTYVLDTWPFGTVWCKLSQYFVYVTSVASVYLLTFMSLDRMLGISRPFLARRIRTRSYVRTICACVWCMSLFVNIPFLQYNDVVVYAFYGFEKTLCGYTEAEGLRSFIIFFFVFGFAMPFLLISVFYATIACHVSCRSSSVDLRRRHGGGKNKTTAMIVIIVAIFGICWLPIHIVLILVVVVEIKTSLDGLVVLMVANCVAYMNCCLNPIVYAFLSKDFRDGFKHTIQKAVKYFSRSESVISNV